MNLFYETEDNSLMHYGVPGMKWGRRKAVPTSGPGVKRHGSQLSSNIQAAKKRYRNTTDKAFSDYEKSINNIEKNYKRGQMLSKKDQAREARTEAKYQQAAKNAKSQYKNAVKNAKTSAVKNYEKEFDKAEKSQNAADKKWSEVQAKYKSLGKTRLTRTLNAARNKSDLAKEYNKQYNDWEKAQNAADKAWKDAKTAYTQTGRNRVEMIFNNIKYGKK